MKKSDRVDLKALVHRLKHRGLKISLRPEQIQQIVKYFSEYYWVAEKIKEEDPYRDLPRQLEDVTKFLLTLDLALISRSAASHLKLVGISVAFFRSIQNLKSITVSVSLLR